VPDLSQPTAISFIIETVVLIFVFVGIGVLAVRRAKKRMEIDIKDDN
jgi:hypothetical protein